MVNTVSGGLYARGGVEVQDVLAVPVGATAYSEALEMIWEAQQSVRDRVLDRGKRPLVADEGGLSPPLDDVEAAFDLVPE